MRFARPATVEDALQLLSQARHRILAGGTDFYPGLRDSVPSGSILDLTAIDELRSIERRDGFWSIGALATWTDIIRAELPKAFHGLKLAAREVGSIQIQNRATVVGNICNASPAADGVPPLLTLDTLVETASRSGRRQIPLELFIRGNRETDLRPDEFVTRLLVPEPSARGASSFLKLGARKYLVISISIVAVRLAADAAGRIDGAAVSVGACSVVAQRLGRLEQALLGKTVSQDLTALMTRDHLEPLKPIDDLRATARYRLDASLELLRRAVRAAAMELQ